MIPTQYDSIVCLYLAKFSILRNRMLKNKFNSYPLSGRCEIEAQQTILAMEIFCWLTHEVSYRTKKMEETQVQSARSGVFARVQLPVDNCCRIPRDAFIISIAMTVIHSGTIIMIFILKQISLSILIIIVVREMQGIRGMLIMTFTIRIGNGVGQGIIA